MKRFTVAYMNFSNNDLELKVVTAVDWWEALKKAFDVDGNLPESLSGDIDGAKEEAYNQDWLFNVIEIPTGE